MAAEIKEKLGFDSELIGGGGGIFDVAAEGQMVFSKQNEGNEFPNHDDVINRLTKIQSR